MGGVRFLNHSPLVAAARLSPPISGGTLCSLIPFAAGDSEKAPKVANLFAVPRVEAGECPPANTTGIIDHERSQALLRRLRCFLWESHDVAADYRLHAIGPQLHRVADLYAVRR